MPCPSAAPLGSARRPMRREVPTRGGGASTDRARRLFSVPPQDLNRQPHLITWTMCDSIGCVIVSQVCPRPVSLVARRPRHARCDGTSYETTTLRLPTPSTRKNQTPTLPPHRLLRPGRGEGRRAAGQVLHGGAAGLQLPAAVPLPVRQGHALDAAHAAGHHVRDQDQGQRVCDSQGFVSWPLTAILTCGTQSKDTAFVTLNISSGAQLEGGGGWDGVTGFSSLVA